MRALLAAFMCMATPAYADVYVLRCLTPCTAGDGTTQPPGTYLRLIEYDGVSPYNPPGFTVIKYANQPVYASPATTQPGNAVTVSSLSVSGASVTGNSPPPGGDGSLIIRVPSTYGIGATATAMSVMANYPYSVPSVSGFGAPSDAALYSGRDSVALFASNTDRAPLLTLTGGTYDATHFYPALPFTAQQAASIRLGVWVETNDTPKFSGQVTAVSTTALTVNGWYQMGNTAAGQVPAGSTTYVDIVTTPFAGNFVVGWHDYYANGTGPVGVEIDVIQKAPFTPGNLFTEAGEKPVSHGLQIVSIGDQPTGAALTIGNNTGGWRRGILVPQVLGAAYVYGGTDGTAFVSGQTAGNAFAIQDRASGIVTAALAPASKLHLGMQAGGTANVPTINLYSSAHASPDAVIRAEGGDATPNNGVLRLFAKTTQIFGQGGDWLTFYPQSAGLGTVVSAGSNGANAPLTFKSQGVGAFSMMGVSSGFDSVVAHFNPVAVSGANQANYIDFGNALSGSPATIRAAGVDANAGLTVAAAGSGTTIVGAAGGSVSLQGTVKAGAVAGVSCPAGTVNPSTMVVTNGIVTHC